MSHAITVLLEFVYLLALLGLAIYGFNNLLTTILYLVACKRGQVASTDVPQPKIWQRVTVQLPVYNEYYTIERLIGAVAQFDYPRDRLQAQVLDDSTDDTTLSLRRLVDQYRAQGLDIELIHRADRAGFKAGALDNGLKTATGDLIAVFDADFFPAPDWLKRTVPQFADLNLGCLQTRWGHLNQKYSLFTRAVALGIDGHFMIEQTARSRSNLFLNFNGTAGLWRRACIEDAGGWKADTLTEDLDLSYRAQMRGWRVGYMPEVVVPAEIPAQIEAFKRQQFRWAKGSIQTARKLVPALFNADIPEHVRLLGVIHITGYLVAPLMLLILLLMLPIGLLAPQYMRLFSWSMVASFGPPLLYLVTNTEYVPRLVDRLRLLPMLVILGFGLCLNNSLAVLEGLFSSETGTFVRTPKMNLTNQSGELTRNSYTMTLSPMVLGELGLALYALVALFFLTPRFGWGIMPWVLVYVGGFSYVAFANLLQNWQLNRAPLKATHLASSK
jgi:cellulose synthase/poly-beta-1,6-N-acetylglucosamine synthase-like glycosyltransferase